jgi:hypothetical protein
MDCPHCGKRVRTDAKRCHRCGRVPALAIKRLQGAERPGDLGDEGSEEHHAAASGGYHGESDFDYEEFLEEEFGDRSPATRRPWWWYVAWVVLLVFALGLLMDAILLLP